MFTGLVQYIGRIVAFEETRDGHHLTLDASGWTHVPSQGDSIAVDGCCLTLTQEVDDSGYFHFDLTHQTTSATKFARVLAGCPVNLEAALRVGDHLGGHLVQGHIDGVAQVTEIVNDPARYSVQFEFDDRCPALCRAALVPAGSITIDGVSLTITDVQKNGCEVVLIPITRQTTTLGQLAIGQNVNVEIDSVAKTVAQVVMNLKLT